MARKIDRAPRAATTPRRAGDRTPAPGSPADARQKDQGGPSADGGDRAAQIRSEVEARCHGAEPGDEATREVAVSLDAFDPVARELTAKVAEAIHNDVLLVVKRHGLNVPAALLALEQVKLTLLVAERRRLGLPLS